MKKLLSIIILLIVFWITYLLQANFFSWFTIAEIKPNLFIILVLFVGLYAGNKISIPFGMMIRYYFRYYYGKNDRNLYTYVWNGRANRRLFR